MKLKLVILLPLSNDVTVPRQHQFLTMLWIGSMLTMMERQTVGLLVALVLTAVMFKVPKKSSQAKLVKTICQVVLSKAIINTLNVPLVQTNQSPSCKVPVVLFLLLYTLKVATMCIEQVMHEGLPPLN